MTHDHGLIPLKMVHFEDAVNVYGRRDDGYARSTWDNVGVQYGLQALLDGSNTWTVV